MSQPQLSVSWEDHLKNISLSLSALQQNNEFVDMTLAADGYFVKVHQLVMAISSPYIKNLISSAQCPHPVIFLNKVSYTTLSSILEYIYTGEVMVSIENLSELLEAAKELHIKGLEDMDIARLLSEKTHQKFTIRSESTLVEQFSHDVSGQDENKIETENDMEMTNSIHMNDIELEEEQDPLPVTTDCGLPSQSKETNTKPLQYTVSNQGSLQMILNRFIYYLKYTNRDKSRQWRCVDYINSAKCQAYVMTKDDVVIQRISAHTHPFHDKRILKKLKSGAIFSALHEAESTGQKIKCKDEKIKDKCKNEK